jgi:cyclic pyranopterin monophosphate synthase
MPRRVRSTRLTHLDARSRPTMVDVGAKPVTHRIAEAQARVRVPAAVARALRRSGHRTKKGPVFDTAIVAGVMAAKRTAELIPFCHPLALEQCQIDIGFAPGGAGSTAVIVVHCRVEVRHKTGVEMEALTGATVAALTIYDMCKALSHDIRIASVRLLSKSGGKRLVGARAGTRARAAAAARLRMAT